MMATIVEQGKMSRTDVGIDLVNWSEAGLGGVNKMLHNTNQILLADLIYPRPNVARRNTSATGTATNGVDSGYLIDGVYDDSTVVVPSSIKSYVVGFNNTPYFYTTPNILVYTVQQLDTANIKVQTSYDGQSFDTTTVTWSETYDNLNDVYVYTVAFTDGVNPVNASFNYIRISRNDAGVMSQTFTEIRILTFSTSPAFALWFFGSSDPGEVDGDQAISRSLSSGTLDICYDEVSEIYYTLKYNDTAELTETSLPFSDDWTTVSGTSNFSSYRWSESVDYTSFTRTGDNYLSFNVSAGTGLLTSNFTLEGGFELELYWEDIEIPASGNGRLELRVVDTDLNVIGAEGVARHYDTWEPVYYCLYSSSINDDSADNADITNLAPNFAVASGTEMWTLTYNSGPDNWSINGATSGAIGTASPGVEYADDYLSFTIEHTSTGPSNGQTITFTTHNLLTNRAETDDTVKVRRDVNVLHTKYVNPTSTMSTGDVRVQIYGTASESTNIRSSQFDALVATGYYIDAPAFSVHRVNALGQVVSDVVTVLDVIGGLGPNDVGESKTYNDFIGGVVGICTDNDYVYVKVEDKLMRFDTTVNTLYSDGETGILNTQGEIPVRNVYGMSTVVFNIDTITGATLTSSEREIVYHYYDSDLDQLSFKTVTTSGLVANDNNRELLIDDSEFGGTPNISQGLPFFWNQNDFNTLYYVDGADGSLYHYNTDDRLVAFVNLNADDPTLAAGTGAGTDVIASVCNAWGAPLSGKTVSFSVTDGDGSVSPATRTTDSEGIANQPDGLPVFTVGSSPTPSTITATVNE